MAAKRWCELCKNFANAKERWQGGQLRTCKFNNKQITTDKKMSQCDGFELYPYVWCLVSRGRFSVEICRIASKEDCATCEIGKLVREILPSKPLTFQPGDINGLSHALRAMRERISDHTITPTPTNGTRPDRPNVRFIRRKPIVINTAPKPAKKRRPIIIRTSKEVQNEQT